MKIKFILFALFSVIVFTACEEKDLSNGRTEPEKKVSDLDIPLDFDWKLTRAVTCNLLSETDVQVYIYNEPSCKDESLVAIHTVTPDDENPLRLHLPIGLETVYVKTGDNVYPVDVEDFNLNFTVPTSTAVTRKGGQNDIIYFPCKGQMATMMFEDYFPQEGDYDFNDLVIYYKYTITYKPRSKQMLNLDFDMTVNALGGIFTFNPCLRLEGLETDYVYRIAPYGCTLAQYKDFDSDVCYRMLGLIDKPEGCRFMNTDPKETIVSRPNLKTARLVIEFKQEGNFVPVLSDISSFNLFLDSDKLEIHEKGNDPAHTDYPKYDGCSGINYCNNKNFVWAITIPTKIKHALERVDFLNAYPDFEGWLKSGGQKNKFWYTNGDSEYLFTIPE